MPSLRAASGVSAWAMRSMISSGMETRRSFFMNSALRRLVSGQMPAMTGMRMILDALEEVLEQAQIEDRLGDGVLGARLDLVGEAAQFVLDVGHAGVGGHADGEVGAGADGVGADVEAVIEAAARC